jgi:hypothetical protein
MAPRHVPDASFGPVGVVGVCPRQPAHANANTINVTVRVLKACE